MKKVMSLKILEEIKTKATRTATALEEAGGAAMMAAFKAISLCTSFALDRYSPNSKAMNNHINQNPIF